MSDLRGTRAVRRTAALGVLVVLAAGCGAHTAATGPATSNAAPVTSTDSAPGSPTSAPGSPASATGSPTSATVSASAAACSNAVVSAQTKSDLLAADGRPGAVLLDGATFYGTCGSVAYAVASFAPAAGDDIAEQVSFQDDGSMPELFDDTGGGWRLVARAGAAGCTTSPVLPSALRAIWHGCTISYPLQSCVTFEAGRVFLQLHSVVVAADGSATLSGSPVTVHCGGPDDFQYDPQPGTETAHLLAGAPVEVLAGTEAGERLPITQLAAYLPHAETDIFVITGTTAETTSVTEAYHP
jgi:hypothetical protein